MLSFSLNLTKLDQLPKFQIANISKQTPKNALIGLAGAGVGYVLYRTFCIWLMRRKYSHIPGPETHGFYLNIIN
jgi:hypothetical protein